MVVAECHWVSKEQDLTFWRDLSIWDVAISCYKKNFTHPIEDVDLSDVNLSVQTIIKYNPDIIIGGPPCQDFSGAGNRVEGDRADLTVSYAKIIKAISPKYFVMENVERAASSEGL